MLIDSPPSHRVSRFVVALLLMAAFLAAVVGLVTVGMEAGLLESAERIVREVRAAWQS